MNQSNKTNLDLAPGSDGIFKDSRGVAEEDHARGEHAHSDPTIKEGTRAHAVRSLIQSEGPFVPVQRLKSLMGFKSDEALNQAIRREKIALSTFQLGPESGLFALTAELGWLLEHGTPRPSRGLHLARREENIIEK